MSDELIQKLQARLAAMENELSVNRRPAFDEKAFRQAMVNDPLGVLTKMGIPVDHVTKALVVHGLGDKADPALRAQVEMGPQINAMMAMQSELAAMRQRLEAFDAEKASNASRTSFASLIGTEKSKYPNLSAAYGANAGLFEGRVTGHRGNAAELADAIEKELASIAGALGVRTAQTASAETAGTTDQSTQIKQAHGEVDNTPPPIPRQSPAVFTQADHDKLRDEVTRKERSQN